MKAKVILSYDFCICKEVTSMMLLEKVAPDRLGEGRRGGMWFEVELSLVLHFNYLYLV